MKQHRYQIAASIETIVQTNESPKNLQTYISEVGREYAKWSSPASNDCHVLPLNGMLKRKQGSLSKRKQG